MIRKKLFLAITAAITGLFTWSCSNNNEGEQIIEFQTETNEATLKIMGTSYAWNLPAETPDLMMNPDAFFKKLLNSQDDASWIKPISEISTSTTAYDIGFEYAMNKYDNGKTYYAILYVKPGTKAAKVEIERGYLITHVSPTGAEKDKIEVTEQNYKTLLPDCITSGKQFSILYRIPNGGEAASTFNPEDVAVSTSYVEDPLYYSNADIYPKSDKKIGYIVYNHFLSSSQYLTPLINKLNEFKDGGVKTLILDLRYNARGGYSYLSDLGGLLVKREDQGAAFAYMTREDASKDVAYPFTLDKSKPNLGDQLDNIYVIIGQSTAGPSETLIHALRAYWGDKVFVTGEDSQGKNLAVSGTVPVKLSDGTSKWAINIALGHFADKNKNYSYRTVPNNELKEINTESGTKEQLKPLGDIEEYVLNGTLREITGEQTITVKSRSAKVSNWPSPVKYLGSSIKSEPYTISLDDLKR